MDEGYIKLHRKLMQWEWYTAQHHVHVFIHLLLRANYKGGRWRGILYERGDVLTSLPKIAADTGLSVRNVRTVLKNLSDTGEVTRKATRSLTHLSIANYDSYQSRTDEGDTLSDTEVTRDRHEGDTRVTANKKDKKDKNDKKDKVTTARFSPPSIDQVKAYCKTKAYIIDAEHFVSYYETRGWMIGSAKMRSWKAALTTWHCRDRQKAVGTTNSNRVFFDGEWHESPVN